MTDYTQQQLELIENIDEKIKSVKTRSLDLSFNEIYSMYESGELIIRPNYQRFFRWDDIQQSQFIESIILEMPIPPIFFVENDDGTYELIDGLQRISAYLKFRGLLKKEDGKLYQPLQLDGCDILTMINGSTFDKLESSVRLKLKRNFVRAEVLKKETPKDMRYHMFTRLNKGGALLSPQELRNCGIRVLDDKFINFINELAKDENYSICMKNIKGKDKMQLEECVLRYFAFKNDLKSFNHNVSSFLDNYLEKVTTKEIGFNYEEEELLFRKIFAKFKEILADKVFSTYSTKTGKLIKGVSKFHFEAFTVGLSEYMEYIVESMDNNTLKTLILDIKKDKAFIDSTGEYKHKLPYVKKRLAIVKKKMDEVIANV